MSKRWENLYLSVPGLDLNCSVIPYDADELLLSFIDKLLEFSPESVLFKVKVQCRDTMIDGFRDRIGMMIDRRTQHLDVNVYLSVPGLDLDCSSIPYYADEMLLSFLTFIDKLLEFSPELSLLKVKIKCRNTMIDGFKDRICTMIDRGIQHLDVMSSPDYYEDTLSDILPVVDFMPMNLLTSKTLVYLKLSSSGLRDPGFVSMPCLRFLHLEQVKWLVHIEKLVSGCPELEELTLVRDLDDEYARRHEEFMAMRVRSKSLKKFRVPLKHRWDCSSEALDLYSKVGMIPKFNNLSRLEAVFHGKLLQFLPTFLECCPNLKHLVLVKPLLGDGGGEGLELTDVPQCVSSTLECVEIQEILELEKGKMKATSYFLGNSAVLKKLILSPTAYDPRNVVESEIYDKVNKLTKRSTGWFRFVMSGRDRISELPECLLTQILSYLPTNQAVQTSVLSKRWENLYLSVPGLNLNCSVIPYDADELLLSFIDNLLEFSPESVLFKVKVQCRDTTIDGFRDRIGMMIDRGTQHLDVVSSTHCLEDDNSLYPIVDMMPMNLYTSKTLVYLKLSSSGLMHPGLVSLPCLKFMHLEEVKWRVHLEKLLSGCPVLEELTLVRDLEDDYARRHDEFMAMRVRSQSLKSFRVLPLRNGYVGSIVNCTLEIDAPGLEYMSLGEDQFDSIVVKNLTSLIMVNLDIKFVVGFWVLFNTWDVSKSNEIRDFLNGITSVRHMIISAKTVQTLDHYSKTGMIPKFNSLSRLEAVFHSKLLQFLPAFLECCPNLKHLVLKVVHSEEMKEGLELTDVPRCVSSTLECVEIQEKLQCEEGKMKATSYFLGNSAVLKKFILSPTAYDPRNVVESEIYDKVNKLTKRSTGCEIIIRAMEEVVII
ncbi:unnamed protein product [Brassica oleracea var. botrytis]